MKGLIRARTIDRNIIHILTNVCKKQKVIDLFGYKIYTHSGRYWNFEEHGFKCCKCGLEATYAAIEKRKRDNYYHINLYGTLNGEEILFTKDHIFPKSLGGKNTIKNYQTMCEKCNVDKHNQLPDNLKYIVDNDLIDSKVVFSDIRIADRLAKISDKNLDNFLEKEINKYY